jgi:hypothetical protein
VVAIRTQLNILKILPAFVTILHGAPVAWPHVLTSYAVLQCCFHSGAFPGHSLFRPQNQAADSRKYSDQMTQLDILADVEMAERAYR